MIKQYALIKDEAVVNVIVLDDSLAATWAIPPDTELEELTGTKGKPAPGDIRDKTKSGSERFTRPVKAPDRLRVLEAKIRDGEDTIEELREYIKLRDGLA